MTAGTAAEGREAEMRLDDLSLGDIVQLQFLERSDWGRLSVRLFGAIPKHSVLVASPTISGRTVAVREGQAVAVRLFTGDVAMAFSSRIMGVVNRPAPYLHLSWPDSVAEVSVRQAFRVSAEIEARIKTLAGREASVQVGDLSPFGAHLRAAAPCVDVGDRLVLLVELPIEALPNEELRLDAVVRNVSQDDAAGVSIGIQFLDLTPRQALSVRAFLYSLLSSAQRQA